jgi:hypothetical protein
MGDPNALVAEPHSLECSATTGATAPASTEQTAATAGSRTVESSVEGGDSSSTREKRTKFDDQKLAKNEEVRRDAEKEKERRGRSVTKDGGLWGSVRRARTVEGAPSNTSGTKMPPNRHVLKKRNSRIDVEKAE